MRYWWLAAAVLCAGWAARAGAHVPEGGEVIFREDFSTPAWTGGQPARDGAFGVEGPALAAGAYGDTVRFVREVDFRLDDEDFITFNFSCAGYQILRILAWEEGDSLPRAMTVTHFPSGEVRHVDAPLQGNFHNYHWRVGSYDDLDPGDRIVRLGLEFSLPEDVRPAVAVGEISVYRLTLDYYRARFAESVSLARREIASLPGELGRRRSLYEMQIGEIEPRYALSDTARAGAIRELIAASDAVRDRGRRLNLYYAKTASALALAEVDYCVGGESSLRRVTHANPQLRFHGEVPARPVVDLAGGEHEAFQLVIIPLDSFLRDVSVTASPLTGPAGTLPASLISVGKTELVRTQYSPHSNGIERGWVPDPIRPLDGAEAFDVEPDAETALWVEVYAPAGTPAGRYSGTLTIHPANSHATVVPLEVTVRDFEIPRRGMFRTQGHFSIESVEEFYHRRMDDRWLAEWYEFWLSYRFDPVGQYSSYLTPRAELIDFCLERGLGTINLGGFSGVGEVDQSGLDSVYDQVKGKGWLDYSYVYIGDETSDFELMRKKADLIHTRYPGVRVMIGGSMPRPELNGYIDVWDPIMRPGGVYGFEPAPCREALARGEEVLWYVCIAPHPPFPNVQMEDPLTDSRSLFWMTYKYDIMGYEYWGYNYWNNNVRPEGEPRWPEIGWNSYSYDHTNGDGQIAYPGPGGRPWPSVRLAVNRDGIEDWEVLWIVEDLARTAGELHLDREAEVRGLVRRAQELADVPEMVVRDLTHYTRDPAVLLQHRREVNETIEKLQAAIGKERAQRSCKRHMRERRELEKQSLERNIESAQRRRR